MAKILTGQTNFTAGELTPKLYGRIDVGIYDNAVESARNAYIAPHGPIIRRNGSQYIAQAKSVTDSGNSRPIKLLKFQYSSDDAYLLEFGDPESGSPYIRFYADEGQILTTAVNITGISQASPAIVTTSGAHGLAVGDNVYITGVAGMTEINRPNKPYQVGTVGSSTTFQVKEIGGASIDSTGFTSYSSGGIVEKIYEISSPYTYDDLDELSYVQLGNVIYLAHPNYAPRKLTRISSTDWKLETIAFSPEPTYESGYYPDTTITPSATSGTSVNFTVAGGIFLQGDVGRQIVNDTTGETGRAVITSITSTTVAVCNIVEAFTDTNAIASGDWYLDLSPLAKLKFSGYEAGSIIDVTATYPEEFRGPKVSISAITKASPSVVTTSTAHGFSSGDKVEILDCQGMTEINTRNFIITVLTSTTFQLKEGTGTGTAFNSTNFNTYTSGGTVARIYENVAQNTFRTADIGRYILANDGVLKVLSITSGSSIKCQILKGLSTQDSTENWTLETADWTADRGYPRCVGLYQERLVFASTESKPVTIYFSETGVFEGFGTGSLDSDAIIVDVSSKQVNQINWISNSRDLVFGSAGSEITVSAPSATSGLSSSNIDIKTRTYHGSPTQNAVNVGSESLFIQGSTRKIRTFRYDFNLDGYTGEDLNFYAEHLTEDGIKEIAYAQEPNSVIYAVTNAGELLVATYVRDQKIIGWTKFTTTGSFENVQVVSAGTTDEVWVTIKRVVNGLTYRYIELFDESTGEDRTDGFSDSFLVYSNPKTITDITKANPAVVTAATHGFSDGDRIKIIDVEGMTEVNGKSFLVANKTTNTFELTTLQGADINSTSYSTYVSGGEVHGLVNSVSGLDHLEGKTVQIKADGATHSNKVVTAGQISLDNYHYEVVVGLPYTTSITTLQKDFDIGMGPMQGQRSRYIRPLLRVYKSTLPLVDGNMTPSRNANEEMDEAVPLFSGDIEYGRLNWSNTGKMTITVTDPLPLQLTGIFGTFEGNLK